MMMRTTAAAACGCGRDRWADLGGTGPPSWSGGSYRSVLEGEGAGGSGGEVSRATRMRGRPGSGLITAAAEHRRGIFREKRVCVSRQRKV